jgi:hypothetical protein
VILYRPVGLEELRLIFEADMCTFPPRLPEQPIFYPVLNRQYAQQIARDWNTQSGSLAGYVTRFEIPDDYAAQFERHTVGARQHEELWVPAEQLGEFNGQITGRIDVIDAYFAPGFEGYIPAQFGMKDRNAVQQFVLLATSEPFDVFYEIGTNRLAVFLHYPFWCQHDFSGEGIESGAHDKTLKIIKEMWFQRFPEIPLPISLQK